MGSHNLAQVFLKLKRPLHLLRTELVIRWWVWYNREMNNSKPGLYANINARRKAGTSRPKSKSTISPKVWRMMKAKKGGFESR
jgi:hypothetical protein